MLSQQSLHEMTAIVDENDKTVFAIATEQKNASKNENGAKNE